MRYWLQLAVVGWEFPLLMRWVRWDHSCARGFLARGNWCSWEQSSEITVHRVMRSGLQLDEICWMGCTVLAKVDDGRESIPGTGMWVCMFCLWIPSASLVPGEVVRMVITEVWSEVVSCYGKASDFVSHLTHYALKGCIPSNVKDGVKYLICFRSRSWGLKMVCVCFFISLSDSVSITVCVLV